MTFTEQTVEHDKLVQWNGNMEATHIYTFGVAGEKFFRALKDGKLLAASCPECDLRFMPPRIYCPSCFKSIDTFVPIEPRGRVTESTVARIGLDGQPLATPEPYGLVAFEEVQGGLFHRLLDVTEEELRSGLEVEAVFVAKGKRRGNILDLKGFRPVGL